MGGPGLRSHGHRPSRADSAFPPRSARGNHAPCSNGPSQAPRPRTSCIPVSRPQGRTRSPRAPAAGRSSPRAARLQAWNRKEAAPDQAAAAAAPARAPAPPRIPRDAFRCRSYRRSSMRRHDTASWKTRYGCTDDTVTKGEGGTLLRRSVRLATARQTGMPSTRSPRAANLPLCQRRLVDHGVIGPPAGRRGAACQPAAWRGASL